MGAVPSKYAVHIWKFKQQEYCNRTGPVAMADVAKDANFPLELQNRLGNWLSGLYDIYSCEEYPSCALENYRIRRQDAVITCIADQCQQQMPDGRVDLKGE